MNSVLEKQTNKQKEMILKKIGMNYKKIKFYETNSSVICENDDENLNEKLDYYYNLKAKVDYILIQLDDNLSKMIYNEFLTKKNDCWWIYFYSKSTYYRVKRKAIDTFMEWWYA